MDAPHDVTIDDFNEDFQTKEKKKRKKQPRCYVTQAVLAIPSLRNPRDKSATSYATLNKCPRNVSLSSLTIDYATTKREN